MAAPAPFRLLTALALASCASAACGRSQPVEAGFWFEPVIFQSKVIDGAVTTADLTAIEAIARAELKQAYGGLPIVISARRDAWLTEIADWSSRGEPAAARLRSKLMHPILNRLPKGITNLIV